MIMVKRDVIRVMSNYVYVQLSEVVIATVAIAMVAIAIVAHSIRLLIEILIILFIVAFG